MQSTRPADELILHLFSNYLRLCQEQSLSLTLGGRSPPAVTPPHSSQERGGWGEQGKMKDDGSLAAGQQHRFHRDSPHHHSPITFPEEPFLLAI